MGGVVGGRSDEREVGTSVIATVSAGKCHPYYPGMVLFALLYLFSL